MEFRILGPLEVREGDRVLSLGGRRQRALLAHLLLHANEAVSSDRLIDELWGAPPPETVQTMLQVYVSRLRKVLSHERLVTRVPGYMLRVDPGQLDARRFERLLEEASEALMSGEVARAADTLRSALGLWRGPALADFAYEAFAQAEISRLEELRLVALSWRVEADLALGRHAELVGELEALVTQYPLRERLRAQLMLALYRSGRQAEALETYREAREALVEGLGIDPGGALQELEGQILRHDPSLDLGASSATAAPAQSPDRSLLVVAGDANQLDMLLAVAQPLSRSPRREVIVARLVAAAGDLARAGVEHEARTRALVERGIPARSAAFTSSSVGSDVVRLASEQEVDLVLLAAPEEFLETGDLGSDVSTVFAEAQCDVGLLIVSVDEAARTREGPVLVPFAGDAHDWAAAELAASIAAAEGCPLQLAGVEAGSDEPGRDASRLLATASLLVQKASGIAAEPLLVRQGADAMIGAARDARLVLIGLPPDWRIGGVREARLSIARVAPTLLVRRGIRPAGLAPRETLTRFSWTLGGAGLGSLVT